jgi:hypothetical protein
MITKETPFFIDNMSAREFLELLEKHGVQLTSHQTVGLAHPFVTFKTKTQLEMDKFEKIMDETII